MKHWPTYLVIITSTVLMQIHSMQFWYAMVGVTGIAWSISAEGAALWLWWKDRKALAVFISLLLISGAFFKISENTINGMLAANTNSALVEDAKNEVDQLARSVDSDESNSRERQGWAKRTDSSREALAAARERYRQLVTAPEASRSNLRDVGSILLQGLLLLGVMTTQIIAVQTLRDPKVKKAEEKPRQGHPHGAGVADTPATPPPPRERPAAKKLRREHQEPKPAAPVITATASDYEILVPQVAGKLETIINATDDETRESGRAIAERCGVRPADVSMVRNHEKHKANGHELISEAALRKLASGLGIEESKGIA